MGHLEVSETEGMGSRIEDLKDIHWCLTSELAENIHKVHELTNQSSTDFSTDSLSIYKKINTVLNSIDRLEVRGRDSAGISLLFIFEETVYQRFNAGTKAYSGYKQDRSSSGRTRKGSR